MKDFWELLNLTQDKIKYGYRTEHEVPEFKEAKPECRECGLYLTRERIVYGSGSDCPKLFIIGSWPTQEDELNNLPLSGEVLEYLKKWIGSLKLSFLGDCYITNLLKCKTGWNKRASMGKRDNTEEINTCFMHLEEEIKNLNPKVILTLGEDAAKKITNTNDNLEGLRGHVHRYHGIPVISTYHPEMALENYQELRGAVWEDLKLVISELNG